MSGRLLGCIAAVCQLPCGCRTAEEYAACCEEVTEWVQGNAAAAGAAVAARGHRAVHALDPLWQWCPPCLQNISWRGAGMRVCKTIPFASVPQSTHLQ